jgi:hypothetical protein
VEPVETAVPVVRRRRVSAVTVVVPVRAVLVVVVPTTWARRTLVPVARVVPVVMPGLWVPPVSVALVTALSARVRSAVPAVPAVQG